MATDMKTIKFGENGKLYSVKPRVLAEYEVIAEEGENLVEVSFEESEYVEMFWYIPQITGDNVQYIIPQINGTKGKFFTSAIINNANPTVLMISIDTFDSHAFGKISGIIATLDQPGAAMPEYRFGKFWGENKISSIGLYAYTNGKFPAGTKVVVKGY